MSAERSPHPNDDRLLDLAIGLLEGDGRRVVLEHLASCGACARRFRAAAAWHERARARVAAAADATGVGRLGAPSDPAGRAAPRAIPAGARTASWIAMAATVAIVAGIAAWPRFAGSPWRDAPGASLPSPDAQGFVRGGEAPADSAVMRGLAAYAASDFAAARRWLESATATGSLEQVRRIYLGVSLLRLDEAGAAATVLAGVDTARVIEPWRSESRWALAEALGRSGRRGVADSLLRVLATEPHEVGDRARRELERRR